MAERGGLEYPYMGSTNRYFSQSLEHLKNPTNGVGPTKGNEAMLKGNQINVPKSNSSIVAGRGGLEYNPNTGGYKTDFWNEKQWANFGEAGGTIEGNKLMLNGQQMDVPKNSSLFGSEGFGMNQGTLKGLGTITDMATGIGGLYLGAQQLSLAKDKFEYDKKMMDKQYAMAKDSYDKQVARANSVGSQMNAGKV